MSFRYVEDGKILNAIDTSLVSIRRQGGSPIWMYLNAETRAKFNAEIAIKSGGLSGEKFIQYNGVWVMHTSRVDYDIAFFDDLQPGLA